MVYRTSLSCIVLLLALGSSLAYVPLPLLHSNKAAKRATCQTRMSTSTLHRPKVMNRSCSFIAFSIDFSLVRSYHFQLHPFDAAERARRKMQHKVDLILLSENKIMEVQEEALTSLTTLDVFSSIIILSLVYSMLPVGTQFFFRFVISGFLMLLFQNWDKVTELLDQNPVWSYIWLNILVRP
jgi:hypothetical protein